MEYEHKYYRQNKERFGKNRPTFRVLEEQLSQSVLNGTLPQFIAELQNKARTPQDFLAWLFLARAHEAIGNIDKAQNCYRYIVTTADKNHPFYFRTLSEVNFFIKRYGLQGFTEAQECTGGRSEKVNECSVTFVPKHQIVRSNRSTTKSRNFGFETKRKETNPELAKANKAFTAGRTQEAYEITKSLWDTGVHQHDVLATIVEALHALKDTEGALKWVDKGLEVFPDNRKFLQKRCDILASLKMWEEAIVAYEKVVDLQENLPARRHYTIQLARAYAFSGKKAKAIEVLDKLLKHNPDDEAAVRIRSSLERDLGIYTDGFSVSTGENLDVPLLDGETEDLEFSSISKMLEWDVENFSYRDPRILAKSGKPSLDDANRLLDTAEKHRGRDFWERYPLFLEAARAFRDCSNDSLGAGKLRHALMRYSSLRAGALMHEFETQLDSEDRNEEFLVRLCDSARSYYLESLKAQTMGLSFHATITLTKMLAAQIASALIFRHQEVPTDLLRYPLIQLLDYSLKHDSDDVARIPCDWVIACSAPVWRKMRQNNYIRRYLQPFETAISQEQSRPRVYGMLSEIAKRGFPTTMNAREVLVHCFTTRRQFTQEVLAFCYRLKDNPLTTVTIRTIHMAMSSFPEYPGVLTSTDHYLLQQMREAIDVLLPYHRRTIEEQANLLFRARSLIESTERCIEEHPTYWGRVGLYPILQTWKIGIRNLEELRLKGSYPNMEISLEPPVFYLNSMSKSISGGILIRNIGKATAEKAQVQVNVCALDEKDSVFSVLYPVNQEILVDGLETIPITIPASSELRYQEQHYMIHASVAPMFQGEFLPPTSKDFTFEVDCGSRLSREDIPWHELKKVPKTLFKGRDQLLEEIKEHLESPDRVQTYLLYGLTRTGKSTVLEYLSEELNGKEFIHETKGAFKFVSVLWNFTEPSHGDPWEWFLQREIQQLEELATKGLIAPENIPVIANFSKANGTLWGKTLEHLMTHKLYPVFLIDEFSQCFGLFPDKALVQTFLALLRQMALEGKASFVYGGTYDIKELRSNPEYGITGQLVHTVERRVGSIKNEAALELIQVKKPYLTFTQPASKHILRLSACVPYFIQAICKNCGLYAVITGRSIVGLPEVEYVVRILTGEATLAEKSEFKETDCLSSGFFENNMYWKNDPPVYACLLSTVCSKSKNQVDSQFILYEEIVKIWSDHGLTDRIGELGAAIEELCDREVLEKKSVEEHPMYRLRVDLFRRWWANQYSVLDMELDKLRR